MARRRKDDSSIVSVIDEETTMVDENEEETEVASYVTEPQDEQFKTLKHNYQFHN